MVSVRQHIRKLKSGRIANVRRHFRSEPSFNYANVTRHYYVKNAGETKAEQRAEWLMNSIAKLFGAKTPLYISKIKLDYSDNNGNVKRGDIVALAHTGKDGGFIILNRPYALPMPKSNGVKLTKKDLLFIRNNANTMAHELAHEIYLTEDNTPEHYRREKQLERKISNLIKYPKRLRKRFLRLPFSDKEPKTLTWNERGYA